MKDCPSTAAAKRKGPGTLDAPGTAGVPWSDGFRGPGPFSFPAAALLTLAAASAAFAATAVLPPPSEPVTACPGVAPSATAPLNGAVGPLAVEEAIRNLASPDWVLQAEAIAVLARAKEPQAVAPLKAILAGQGHPWVRGRALVALAEIKGADAVDDALAMASHLLPEVRAAALEALGATASPRAVAAVESRVNDPAAVVRYQAVVALARLKHQDAMPRVATLLAQADPQAVCHAARALVYVGTAQARGELLKLLAHPDGTVRAAAAQAEREVRDPQAIGILLTRMADDSTAETRAAAERALLAYHPQALAKPCLDALGPTGLPAAYAATFYPVVIRILAARPSKEARDGLAAILRDAGAERLRSVLIPALEVVAGEDPTPYLDVFVKRLDHHEATVRRRVIEWVARCRGADLFGLLRPSLSDKLSHISEAAFKAVGGSTEGAPPEGIVAYLADALKSSDADIVADALTLMADRLTPLEAPKALSAIEPILGGASDQLRRLAVAAVERLADADLARRVAEAQGCIIQWQVIGPFPNDVDNRGFTAVYPPETDSDPAKLCEAHILAPGTVFKVVAAAAGDTQAPKSCLSVRPPEQDGVPGRVIVAYTLDLPLAADLKLSLACGIQADAPDGGDGVRFEAAIDGRRILERKVIEADGWVPMTADLAPWAGKRIVLELLVDALEKAAGDWAVVAEPRITAAGSVAADLLKLAPTASVRSLVGDARPPRLAWESVRVRKPSGNVDLHEAVTQEDFKVAYAIADINWPADQKVYLVIAADESVKAWLNGEKIGERATPVTPLQAQVTLRRGRNRLLLKVCNQDGAWTFSARIVDGQGARLAPGGEKKGQE